MKRWISLVLTATLVTGSVTLPAMAAESEAGSATTADLSSGPADDLSNYDESVETPDEESAADDKERGRLSMQRVMKNVSYKEEEADFSQSVDSDDIENSLFEDDDDMEYSFISSTRRK